MKRFLRSNKSAKKFEDCYPQGNGSLGIMDNGNPVKTKLVINDEAFWSGSIERKENKKYGREAISEIREALEDKDFNKAERQIKEEIAGNDSESFIPLGCLFIDKGFGVPSNYHRTLNLEKGVLNLSYSLNDKEYIEDSFVSYPDQVYVKRIVSSGKSVFKIRFSTTHPVSHEQIGDVWYISGNAPSHIVHHDIPARKPIVYDNNNPGMTFVCGIKIETDAENIYSLGEGLRVVNATYCNIFLSTATGIRRPRWESNESLPKSDELKRKGELSGVGGVASAGESVSIGELASVYEPVRKGELSGVGGVASVGESVSIGELASDDKPVRKGELSDVGEFERKWHSHAELKEDIREVLDSATQRGYKECLDRHVADYSSLFDRVKFSLNGCLESPKDIAKELKEKQDYDALITTLYDFNRYLVIASSREASLLPSNLQGLWCDSPRPKWSSGYTMNINLQMNYWPVMGANLAESASPFCRFMNNILETGKLTAKEVFGCNGFVLGHNSDGHYHSSPVGGETKFNSSSYSLAVSTSGWLINQMFDMYLYSESKKMLKEQVFRVAEETIKFYIDYLWKDKEGNYCIGPDISPENSYIFDSKKYSVDTAPAITMAVIRELFNNYLKFGKDVGLKKTISNILPLLPGYKIASDGSICEWSQEFEEGDPHHRHLSHLYGLYPGSEMCKDPKLLEGCKTTLEKRGKGGTGWSLAWKICLYARLKNGEEAYEYLKQQFNCVRARAGEAGGSYKSLLSAHPPYQIDGNFGTLAGINEMLVQSHDGEILPIPAIPSCWESGYVEGIRVRGNKTVTIKWEKGKILQFEVNELEKI